MFKSAIVYRIESTWAPISAAALAEALAQRPFVACGPTERHTSGWVSPRKEANSPLVEAIGGHYILKLLSQARILPSSAVKDELEERLDALEESTGRRPKGQAKRDLREQIEIDLLPRAFTKTGATLVWLDPHARLLYISAGSQNKADAISTELIECLGNLPLKLVQTITSPATAMSTWLREQFSPAAFSLDQECELRQPDEGKATVRYSRHNLETDEVVKHIEQGKLPTQLAMTFNRRISFILTDTMQIRKIKVLDVVIEDSASATGGKDDSFDADVAIMTGELSKLFPALLEALDGELVYGDDI